MPRRNGTGPMGTGAMTGRGYGLCTGGDVMKNDAGIGLRLGFGCGCGLGRGIGRGLAVNQTDSETQKEMLQEKRAMLKNRLQIIDKQLGNL